MNVYCGTESSECSKQYRANTRYGSHNRNKTQTAETFESN